ncbi:hypothetical protein UlMin_030413 [Ulmus minor]
MLVIYPRLAAGFRKCRASLGHNIKHLMLINVNSFFPTVSFWLYNSPICYSSDFLLFYLFIFNFLGKFQYDCSLTPTMNIGLTASLLSHFDLLFIVLDQMDSDIDTNAYRDTDSEFLKSENNQNRDAGSTASTAILVGDRLLVENVGDSKAVICRGGNASAVSRDHKPDQTDERQRIEDAGGFVMWARTWRVGGVLVVSRAFGDRLLKQYVFADPEIQEENIDNSLEFLILASDGLWDVVTNERGPRWNCRFCNYQSSSKEHSAAQYSKGHLDHQTRCL